MQTLADIASARGHQWTAERLETSRAHLTRIVNLSRSPSRDLLDRAQRLHEEGADGFESFDLLAEMARHRASVDAA